MKISEEVLQEIAEQTDNNDHGGALLTAANALGLTFLAELLVSNNSAHERLGYLSPELCGRRDRIADAVFAFAKINLSAEDYDKLYHVF